MGSPEFSAWQLALRDLTDEQVMAGVKRSRDHTGFFSLPVFREFCKEQASAEGVPPLQKAYEEACRAPSPKVRHPWSHPVVYHAGVSAGWSDLHALDSKAGLELFKYHYGEMCKRWSAGEDLSIKIPDAIPEHISPILEPEQAAEQVTSIRSILGVA